MSKYDFKLDVYGDNTIAWIANSVEPNSRVLEFGPANGRLTKYLSEEKQCKVDIVEIDEESGKDAMKYAVNSLVGPIKGNIENYHWMDLDVQYDYIIFADVLEHLINPDEVLKHCSVKVKENGKVIVSIPNIAHNSVIIDLMNDKFNYNPTGILDSTHLRFYTRESFGNMALSTGWTIVEEKAKQIRAGETEIANCYKNVSKEVFKELAHRENGNVYQYFFVLSQCSDYLQGKCERRVSLDSTSYYYTEIYFEHDGVFDYKKSATRHFDPYYGRLEVKFENLDGCEKVVIKPINCNCVLKDINIIAENDKDKTSVALLDFNGEKIGDYYYFIDKTPELSVTLPSNTSCIFISLDIIKYDFEDEIISETYNLLTYEMNHIVQICKDYEREIMRIQDEQQLKEQEYQAKEQEYQAKEQEYQNTILELRQMLNKKNRFSGVGRRINEVSNAINRKINKKKIRANVSQKKENLTGVEIKPVTAVIPNYNYARYLVERLDSIIFQTYPVKEVIILDDCSTDNSIEVIEQYIQEEKTDIPITLIKNEKNSGSVFAQWQKAFQVSNGDYVWIAEADDSCNERFLETIMKGFDDPEVVISYCESLTIDENNNLLMGDLRVWIDIFNTGKWDQDYIKDGKLEVAETMCINNTIANVSSAVIKNDDYNDIFENAKAYKLAGDWYSYMNILMRGKIAYYKESLNYHRMQKQGLTLSTSHEKEFEEIVRLQDFALENFEISEEIKQKVFERRERERVRFGL